MRERREIVEDSNRPTHYKLENYQELSLEVLLDIRDLLKNCRCIDK